MHYLESRLSLQLPKKAICNKIFDMSACYWTVQKTAENEVIVLFNGIDVGHGSITSVDVPPDDSDERDEFVKVLFSPPR